MDSDNWAGHDAPDLTPTDDTTEPGAAGDVVRPTRFGVGTRSTILLGLTMGAVAAATVVLPWTHVSVSSP
jgi:hypothetical protein